VPDVEKFPGHIACSSASVSEIVVPVFDKNGKVVGLMDVDSERADVLDDIDRRYLEKICHLISKSLE
jgi:GAF domain-containing protein